MRKVNKLKPDTSEVLVVEGGISYKVLDLGGTKLKVRVKSPKELLKDKKAFDKYLSGRDEDSILPPTK